MCIENPNRSLELKFVKKKNNLELTTETLCCDLNSPFFSLIIFARRPDLRSNFGLFT